MRRALIYSFLCLSIGLISACSDNPAYEQSAKAALPDKDQLEVTGCLTANRDTNQFVLTANTSTLTALANRAGAGEAENFHYQLVGGANLQDYVGKEVVVKGSIEGKGDDVNLEVKEKEEGLPTRSRGEEVTPAIETKQEIEMQVERLNVASIRPTGASCPTGKP